MSKYTLFLMGAVLFALALLFVVLSITSEAATWVRVSSFIIGCVNCFLSSVCINDGILKWKDEEYWKIIAAEQGCDDDPVFYDENV